MNRIYRFVGLACVLAASALIFMWPGSNMASPLQQAPESGDSVTPGVSAPVTTLPISRVPEEVLITEINPRQPPRVPEDAPGRLAVETRTADALLAEAPTNEGRTPMSSLSVDGLASAGPIPPDTIGEVGPNHYVQMVNVRFAIYNKAGTLVTGPHDFNQLFAGQQGQCANRNDGDPVVVYDRLVDRWLLSQFARPSHMCMAVSQTPDPTGAYFLYEFNVGAFPDYFKLGVWPDAYYMSANESSYTAYAFDRLRMVAGAPATFQKFTGERNLLLPAHFTGATPPPAGTPGYFYTFKDSTFHGGESDRLELFELAVDWAVPANSTFTLVTTLSLTPFNYTVCGFFNFSCISQPAPGERVDAISEWPMWRFQYRNLGAHEALVGNFTIEVDGNQHAGIRWFELRRGGGSAWALQQEGTHAPDRNHRWLGSIGMDRDGNLALGYSATGADLNPEIRYATRLASDPAGTLQAEATLQAGGGVQTGGSNRWGDYSSMSVDPGDDCTFWYTNQYYQATSPGTWQTRFGAFRLESCGEVPPERPAYEYAVKLVCGVQENPEDLRLARGVYATIINVRNPNNSEVTLRKQLALAIPPGDQQPGEVLDIAQDVLQPGQALAVDCMDVERRVFDGSWPASYVDGFVTLQSRQPLDVIAVYTTLALDEEGGFGDHSSIDVERVEPRTLSDNLPDLIVRDIDLGTLKVDCPTGGGSCITQVEFTVANVGAANAGPFRVLSLFDPAQSVPVDLNVAGGLASGAEQSFTATTAAGGNCFDPDCTICVTVDHLGDIAESNEGNNNLCATLPG